MEQVLEKIKEYALEEVMEDRFARYAKYIIQDRALPDVRDGLKPVQRRILYSMYKERNTFDQGYKKSAKTVGDVIGKYHPHGDTSIYEAMVRMSQDWKLRTPLIDMHGNNGSIDGDSPAAYRYTEARLARISNELLKDMEKETVVMAANFDDTEFEPTVLPARFPNLLVNGSSGISAGYATNIPPHNLGEVMMAVIKRLEEPDCSLKEILKFLKGPDFPTGAIIEGSKGLEGAYQTGKGRIYLKAKTEVIRKSKYQQLVITEIPYEVNKASLVRKIDEIRIDKQIEGIISVRDESDREGLRVVVELKHDADSKAISNYLFKNTDLYLSYNFNMVAIMKRRPKLLGLLAILDAYIEHQKEVIRKRSKFDLKHAETRLHLVKGLIKALSILDDVIKTIRASKNKKEAEANLVKVYDFSKAQAEAIVLLQLYKLTNTDVKLLVGEMKDLELRIKFLESVLADEELLKKVIKHELEKIKEAYATPRLTVVQDQVSSFTVDISLTIPQEEVVVVVSKAGYVKRVSLRSYGASKGERTLLRELDYELGVFRMKTLSILLLFTNLGNYLYVPVHEIPELKWKELGKHISNIIPLKQGEEIIGGIPVNDFKGDEILTFFTKQGMVKRTYLKEYEVSRYRKPLRALKLKVKDEVVGVTLKEGIKVLMTTRNGYGLMFGVEEIPLTGVNTSGVKGINLKEDEVIGGHLFKGNETYLIIITKVGTGKRIKLETLKLMSRNRRGTLLRRNVKSNPYEVLKTFLEDDYQMLGLCSKSEIEYIRGSEISILDLNSTGKTITKHQLVDAFLVVSELKEEELKLDLDEVDEQLKLVDDYLKEVDFKEIN